MLTNLHFVDGDIHRNVLAELPDAERYFIVATRSSDLANCDVLSRLGGDEVWFDLELSAMYAVCVLPDPSEIDLLGFPFKKDCSAFVVEAVEFEEQNDLEDIGGGYVALDIRNGKRSVRCE